MDFQGWLALCSARLSSPVLLNDLPYTMVLSSCSAFTPQRVLFVSRAWAEVTLLYLCPPPRLRPDLCPGTCFIYFYFPSARDQSHLRFRQALFHWASFQLFIYCKYLIIRALYGVGSFNFIDLEGKEEWHTFAWYVVHREGMSEGINRIAGFRKLQTSHLTNSASHESLSNKKNYCCRFKMHERWLGRWLHR